MWFRYGCICRRERYYTIGQGGSLFEKLHALRKFEDVLMDIISNTPEIDRLEDVFRPGQRVTGLPFSGTMAPFPG